MYMHLLNVVLTVCIGIPVGVSKSDVAMDSVPFAVYMTELLVHLSDDMINTILSMINQYYRAWLNGMMGNDPNSSSHNSKKTMNRGDIHTLTWLLRTMGRYHDRLGEMVQRQCGMVVDCMHS